MMDRYDTVDNSESQSQPCSGDLVRLDKFVITDLAGMSWLPVKPILNAKLGYPRKLPGIGGDHGEVFRPGVSGN